MVTVSNSLANHITWMIEALCKLVAREGRRLHVPRPLIVLAVNRIVRLTNRFLTLVHRLNEGRLAAPARRRTAAPRPPAGAVWRARHIGWVLRLVRSEIKCCAGSLEYFLSFPEMPVLVAAEPQAGRIFRPMCRMLGVNAPPWLRLPRRSALALATPEPADAPPALAVPEPTEAPLPALAAPDPTEAPPPERTPPGPWPEPHDPLPSDPPDVHPSGAAAKNSD